MGFFDLDIPYRECDRHITDKPSLRGHRLKLALRAMELGYTGVAYNRTVKGVMSESNRCSTVLFPITKLTPSSSSFFASVKFHRELLNVAVTAPFRQYTRLTVIVDDLPQAAALNSGNPVLRTYDIVAVRPKSQTAFDQACQTSEVDIIAIDFSKEMLPFRLRQPMVKAAIKRGVYFEITYSGLITDAESKRHMISNCKLLVDWTGGKNLIIGSAARSAADVRGPQDVANLLFLLGLSRERAKAATSSNCRSLLANALKKKHFYKEAVKVEVIPSVKQFNPGKSMLDDWLKWDPISSGQGDVLLDDMEKSFAISKTVKENEKTINFTSNLKGMPAHGFQIKDIICPTKAALESPDVNLSHHGMEIEDYASAEKCEVQGDLNTLHEEQPSPLKNEDNLSNLSNDHGRAVDFPESQMSPLDARSIHLNSHCQDYEDHLPLPGHNIVSVDVAKAEDQNFGLGDSSVLSLPTSCVKSTDPEESTQTSNNFEVNHSDDLDQSIIASKTQLHGAPSHSHQENYLHGGGQPHFTNIKALTTNKQGSIECSSPLVPAVEHLLEMGLSPHEGNARDKILSDSGIENMQEQPFVTSCEDGYAEGGQYSKVTDNSFKLGDELPLEGYSNATRNIDEPINDDVMAELNQIDSVTDFQGLAKSHIGMNKRKGKSLHQPFLFPFKRSLKARPFKRKHQK